MIERHVTRGDVFHIVRGGGGNNKKRFEIGTLYDEVTEAVRAAQGHSLGIGVGPGVLPLATNLTYVVNGTSLQAAKNISNQ